jgi:hypothetical protein
MFSAHASSVAVVEDDHLAADDVVLRIASMHSKASMRT